MRRECTNRPDLSRAHRHVSRSKRPVSEQIVFIKMYRICIAKATNDNMSHMWICLGQGDRDVGEQALHEDADDLVSHGVEAVATETSFALAQLDVPLLVRLLAVVGKGQVPVGER